MYDGARSPCTQMFGLGLCQMPTAADLDQLEAFFQDRRAPVSHEVSPPAGKALLPMLQERGYRPVEWSNVMSLRLAGQAAPAMARKEPFEVCMVRGDEQELWARTAAEGWREFTQIADLMLDLMRVTARREDGASFLVKLRGQPIAAGALAIHDRVALLAGASTIPEWHGRGGQRRLLARRLEYAARAGCDLAMVCAEPGSASPRNAERQGFHVAYTRTKFAL
jgi:GNAT superfamily N-acetyltransferase